MNRCSAMFFLLGALLVFAASATAQEREKWEVEFHGGGMLVNNPTGGTASLPDPGPAFITELGRPSRRESSWYFGDGALLLNQVNTARARARRSHRSTVCSRPRSRTKAGEA